MRQNLDRDVAGTACARASWEIITDGRRTNKKEEEKDEGDPQSKKNPQLIYIRVGIDNGNESANPYSLIKNVGEGYVF